MPTYIYNGKEVKSDNPNLTPQELEDLYTEQHGPRKDTLTSAYTTSPTNKKITAGLYGATQTLPVVGDVVAHYGLDPLVARGNYLQNLMTGSNLPDTTEEQREARKYATEDHPVISMTAAAPLAARGGQSKTLQDLAKYLVTGTTGERVAKGAGVFGILGAGEAAAREWVNQLLGVDQKDNMNIAREGGIGGIIGTAIGALPPAVARLFKPSVRDPEVPLTDATKTNTNFTEKPYENVPQSTKASDFVRTTNEAFDTRHNRVGILEDFKYDLMDSADDPQIRSLLARADTPESLDQSVDAIIARGTKGQRNYLRNAVRNELDEIKFSDDYINVQKYLDAHPEITNVGQLANKRATLIKERDNLMNQIQEKVNAPIKTKDHKTGKETLGFLTEDAQTAYLGKELTPQEIEALRKHGIIGVLAENDIEAREIRQIMQQAVSSLDPKGVFGKNADKLKGWFDKVAARKGSDIGIKGLMAILFGGGVKDAKGAANIVADLYKDTVNVDQAIRSDIITNIINITNKRNKVRGLDEKLLDVNNEIKFIDSISDFEGNFDSAIGMMDSVGKLEQWGKKLLIVDKDSVPSEHIASGATEVVAPSVTGFVSKLLNMRNIPHDKLKGSRLNLERDALAKIYSTRDPKLQQQFIDELMQENPELASSVNRQMLKALLGLGVSQQVDY